MAMKIVSDETTVVIEFTKGVFTNEKPLDGFFSLSVNIRTPSFSVIGKDIWYGLNEFELFIADLKLME